MSGTEWWKKLWTKQWYDSLDLMLDRIEVEALYGDEAKAISQLKEIIKQNPREKRVYLLLAESYNRLGTTDIAIKQMQKALEIDPGDYDLLLRLSKLYSNKGELSNAYLLLERAYKLRPYEISLLPRMAEYLTRSSNPDKAIKTLEKYLQYRDNPQVRYQLAQTYYLKGDYLNTIRIANQLLEADKNNYKYLTLRGKCYFRTNNYQRAYYDMTMSLDLYPNQPELFRLVGEAAYFIGHKEEACLYWQRSYELFHDKNALQLLNKTCKKH